MPRDERDEREFSSSSDSDGWEARAARLKRRGALLRMTKDSKFNRSEGIDRIGKILLVVSTRGVGLRKCLVCEGVHP